MTQVKKVRHTTGETDRDVPKQPASACVGVVLLGRRQEPWPVLWAPRSAPPPEPSLKRSASTKRRPRKILNRCTRTV